MIALNGTTQSLTVVLAGAPATTQPAVIASWADVGGIADGSALATNGTTAVTAVPAPAASVLRIVRSLSIYNRDTAAVVVTISKAISATSWTLAKVTLAAGYTLSYTDDGWQVIDTNGGIVASGGGSGGMTNPMTAVGDMIVGGTSGAPTRIAIGTTAYVWTSNGTTAGWAAAAGGVALSNTSAWTKNQYVAPSTLTYAATVTPNASLSNNFVLTMTGACTLANPTSLQSGMVLNFCLNQDATGGRVITFGSAYKWPGGIAPTWITTASAKNFFSAYYDGTILRCNGGAGYA